MSLISGHRAVADGTDEPLVCSAPAVHLEVIAAAAPVGATERLRQGAFGRLVSRPRCDVTWTAEPAEAEMIARLRIVKWLESESPGGAPQFEPETGRYVSGSVHRAEIRYAMELAWSGEEEPLSASKTRTMTPRVASMKNPLWDPLPKLEQQIHDSLASRLAKFVCKEVARIEKRSRKRCEERPKGDRVRADPVHNLEHR